MDTAGLYQFPAMLEVCIKSCRAFIIVFSIDSQDSFCDALKTRKLILDTKGKIT